MTVRPDLDSEGTTIEENIDKSIRLQCGTPGSTIPIQIKDSSGPALRVQIQPLKMRIPAAIRDKDASSFIVCYLRYEASRTENTASMQLFEMNRG